MMDRRNFLKAVAAGFLAFYGKHFIKAEPTIEPLPLANRWLPVIPGGPQGQFGFLAMGDMGTGWKTQHSLIQQMHGLSSVNQFPSVVLLGDLLYPSAQANLIQPNIIAPFQPMINSGYRFYPIWGNHDWVEKEAKYVKEYFVAPNYYTYKFGSVQVWALNSNDFDSLQANWLAKSLSLSNAPWKVALIHHSPYSSGKVHRNSKSLIKNLCPILSQYKVDLCLSGHNHIYERTEKIDGVVYIVSGGGSASLHKYEEKVDFPRAFIKSDYHFLKVYGNNSQLISQAIDINGNTFDRLILSK